MIKKIIYIVCFLALQKNVFAQSFQLYFQSNNQDSILSLTQIPTTFLSVEECEIALKEAQQSLIKKGFLASNIDSIFVKDNNIYTKFYLGKKYQWVQFINENIPSFLLNENSILKKNISIQQVEKLFENVIKYFENNGHPFCYLQLKNIQENNGNLQANLFLEKGNYIKIDSIKINEDAPIHKSYLLHYLDLQEGMPYNEQKIKAISKKIAENNFIQEASPWKIYFNTHQTVLQLFVKSKSSNQADALIGLMPNNSEIGGKFLVTGDIKLSLVNSLNRGEKLQLNWQNLQYKSPRYNIKFQYPYLLNTVIGITTKFDFYKKDTSFKTVNGQVGLQYQLNTNDYFKLFYELNSSQLLGINKAQLIATKILPSTIDVSNKTIGFEWQKQHVDNIYNTKKGYILWVNMGISSRNFKKNSTVETIINPDNNKPFSYLYDSLHLKSNKYNVSVKASNFIPIKKRATIATILQIGYVFSNQKFFKNELFQIGGFRLLRGFDEGILFVNNYKVLTLEPRYILTQNSFVYMFTDVAHIEINYANIHQKKWAYSGGLGLQLSTKNGLFNLAYAVGKLQQEDFILKNAKIHFGYVSVF